MEQNQKPYYYGESNYKLSEEYFLELKSRLSNLEVKNRRIMDRLALVQIWNDSLNSRINRLGY